MQTKILLRLLQGGLFLVPLAVWPSLYQPFETTKWALLYFIAFFLACTLVSTHSSYKTSSFAVREFIWILVIAATYLISVFYNAEKGFSGICLDWLSYLAIAWSTYIVRKTDPHWFQQLRRAFYLAVGICLLYSLTQFLGWDLFATLYDSSFPEFPYAFWGFQNFYAEFLGLAAIFLAFDIVYSRKRVNAHRVLFLGATLFFLGLQQTRSVLVALVIALVFTIYLETKRRRFVFLTILCAVLTYFGGQAIGHREKVLHTSQHAPLASNETFTEKGDLQTLKTINAQIRIIRWQNVLKMIADHPWGIGPGKFPYAYLPYHSAVQLDSEANEKQIVNAPHNGYLEYIVENGWIAALCLFLFLARILVWPTCFAKTKSRKLICLRIVLLYFLVDAVFSFPMELPFPFFVAAMGLGFWFSEVREKNYSSNRVTYFFSLAIRAALVFVIAWKGGAWGYSQFVFSFRGDDFESVERACAVYPEFWHNCLHKAQLEEKKGEPMTALKTLAVMMRREENLFPAIRLTAIAAFKAGKQELGCLSLAKYEELFPELRADDKQWSPIVAAYCPFVSEAF